MKKLRAIRQSQGLSQQELAEMSGVHQSTISKIERGKANPTEAIAISLADALKVSPAQLFGLSELQQRVIAAFSRMDPEQQTAAIVVLEAMAQKPLDR